MSKLRGTPGVRILTVIPANVLVSTANTLTLQVEEVACAVEGVDVLSVETQCASYDRLNPYANLGDLGDLEPVNLISFAYQIASGMVHNGHMGKFL